MNPTPVRSHQQPSKPVDLTDEDLALLRASVAFHVQVVSDSALRARLEAAAAKLTPRRPDGAAAIGA